MPEMLAAIKQSGPPTKNTPGAVGQDYVDIDTGLRWECVEAASETFYKRNKVVYNWELRGLDPDFVVDGLPSGNMLLLTRVPTVMPQTYEQWISCYGDGKFVAVSGRTNIAAYSTDGINWTQTTLPTGVRGYSVCYGNGKFVTVVNNVDKAITAYSTDGINWTQTTLPANGSWASVCYGNGKFVTLTYYNTVIAAYSTDGINWIQTTLPAKANWSSVCYGNDKFVAVGRNVAAYSTDGINWTQTTLPDASWWGVCYGGDKFVATPFGKAIAAYSTDGINWTQTTLPAKANWGSVCYGNGKFVTVATFSNIAAYSADGINWIQATVPTVECLSGTNATDDLKKALGINAPVEAPSGGEGGSLPVKLDILGTVVDNKTITGSTKKYLFPSGITLNDGDLYLLVYKYFYNGAADPNNHIVAVSRVSNGEVYWGNTDPNNSVKMDKTGVYDNWLATNDDTTKSIVNIYKVQKTITDDAAYHAMHLEGYDSIAPGIDAHAEGYGTVASGMYSHAEGANTEAKGEHSHAEGFNTKAAGPKQHVEGSYNVVDEEGVYAHIVGNGTDESYRSNAYTLDWEGNAKFAGNVYANGEALAKKPVTKYFTLPADGWGSITGGYTHAIVDLDFVGDNPNVFFTSVQNYPGVQLISWSIEAHALTFCATNAPTEDITAIVTKQETTIEREYLAFSSPSAFTMSVTNPGWDGKLEYSTDAVNWKEWKGEAISGTTLYFSGTGNTKITGGNINYYDKYKWTISGRSVSCTGNIESLLDWRIASAGGHPEMANDCYANMFVGCEALTVAPELPATTLVEDCYRSMFLGCTSLTTAPALPATTLTAYCYYGMFHGCSSLTTAPALPATTLTDECYSVMFSGCTALTAAPELPATTLADWCYAYMFEKCTALTTAPALPATTLTARCYHNMFLGCTSLTTAPTLPATTLAVCCYYCMFMGCTSLTTAPTLPATTLAEGCYQGIFFNCYALTVVPALPATTLERLCYNATFKGCSRIKLSTTQTNEYTQEYRIPTTGTGTTAEQAFKDMFTNTGGTFRGTPEINTTYYLHKDCTIV